MDLIARLLRTPVVSWLVRAPAVALAAFQCLLGPGAGAVEEWRHRLWLRAEALLSPVGGYTTDRTRPSEYVCSVPAPPLAVERDLWLRGFRRNLLAAKKYRDPDGAREWSVSSWVHREQFWADRQLHVTLFRRPDGTDCYAHREPSNVARPLDHWLVRGQASGDSRGTLRAALDDAGLAWFRDAGLASVDAGAD